MVTFGGLSVAFLFVYTTGLTAFLLNPAQRCTFESGDCGYSQASSQRLHWSVRHVGGSNNPTTDHTYNRAGQGNVLVVDTDGVHGHYGKISTPSVHYARGQPVTVRFSFINAGDHPMELVMFVKGGSRQPGRSSYTSIGRRSTWHDVCIDDVVNGDVTVEFEAIVLRNGSSYLAIDDVTIDAGMTCSGATTPYSGILTTASPVAASVTCNFESASICGYVNVNSTDNIDWLHNRGSTPSQRTGPVHDHTTGSCTYDITLLFVITHEVYVISSSFDNIA
ncbi:MAM and LDL-receptor class A domain-containing protein 1-like [Mya arenaria]|uniref:MAM and LDL-receptor class A domain-containing protein 1-like n=1 Tax=Mya arenaria TaxID=6604 RepID=UPI0022E25798|nr:MAM and LDL-receptor class A domain-containing protein 1-like [Mya arenaria]